MYVSPDFDREFAPLYERCHFATMTTAERMFGLYKAVRYIVEAGIPGSLVECGVWKGGSVMMMAETLMHVGQQDRDLYLFDTFDRMPPPSDVDVRFDGISAQSMMDQEEPVDTPESIWCMSNEAEVRANLRRTRYPEERFHLIPGRVEDTIPGKAPENIALLRLDTDWYDSTLHELEHLYPRLAPGGVLIIDDYGHWDGARKATDEYLARLPVKILLNRLDFSGRIAVKRV